MIMLLNVLSSCLKNNQLSNNQGQNQLIIRLIDNDQSFFFIKKKN